MKYNRIAAAAALATGAVAAVGSAVFPNLTYPGSCGIVTGDVCTHTSILPPLVGALGVLLIFDSLLSLVGPRRALYGLTVVSLLMAAFMVMGISVINADFFWVTVVLALATAALSVLAARARTGFTEQSNPMNLPVFG